MNVICGGRQTGKTQKLIELCAEAEARGEVSYIVCHNEREAYRIAQVARELDKKIAFPISYSEFLHGQYGRSSIHNFFIDNAEMLVQYLTPVQIAAITVLRKDDG